MSESSQPSQTRNEGQTSAIPRAIIHKKILDAAETEPDATIEELAENVNGASANLVEQVLEEYGDPIADEPKADEPKADDGDLPAQPSSQSTEDGLEIQPEQSSLDQEIDQEQFTEKQHATFKYIYKNPNATQKEIAENFGVSSATICHRVNEVDGFEWNNRREFVEQIFEITHSEEIQMSNTQPSPDLFEELDELLERVKNVEQKVQTQSRSRTALDDPALVHKVVHACVHSDQITEEEELKILRSLLEGGPDSA